jgi:multiple sugar transport system substrate-binding protein
MVCRMTNFGKEESVSGEQETREARYLMHALGTGRISRREFVRRATALGLSASAISFVLAACGGEEEEAPAPTLPEGGPSGASDEIAVEAAKQFSGVTLNATWESGLQALDPKELFGPEWERLTGIKVTAIELDHPDLFSKAFAEHLAGSGAFDLLNIAPFWLQDMVNGGVVEPLDDFVAKYYNREDLEDYAPLYETFGILGGTRYALFDDGDTLILYYRKDVFEEMGLEVPETWEAYIEVAQAITDERAPDMYGCAMWRKDFNHFDFWQQYRVNGGEFFDVDSMEAKINGPEGLKTLESMIAQNKATPPGSLSWGPIEVLNAWMEGRIAMCFWWAPVGRWSAGLAKGQTALEFVPESTVVGKAGYAVMPGGHGEMASGFEVCVSADSKNKEAAYLLAQWITSPKISLERVLSPIALRDPYRLSHFEAEEYRNLWPEAGEYLDTLQAAQGVALIDMIMPGAQDYALAIDRQVVAAYAGGKSAQEALDTAAAEWNSITEKIGADAQREAYQAFLELPGSAVENVVGDA